MFAPITGRASPGDDLTGSINHSIKFSFAFHGAPQARPTQTFQEFTIRWNEMVCNIYKFKYLDKSYAYKSL